MGKEWDSIGTGRKGNPFDPKGQHIAAMSGQPDKRAHNKGGTWYGSRTASSPSGFAPQRMPKCGICGKWRYNATKSSQCACPDPEWVHDTSTYPRKMQSWHESWLVEAYRVLKPGAVLLAFGGTRTWHRLACAVEDAGFEVKDCLMWLYGSGFPKHKSLLKPGWEPVVVAKKPGPGGMQVEACRIGTSPDDDSMRVRNNTVTLGEHGIYGKGGPVPNTPSAAGRWPANVVLSHIPPDEHGVGGCRPVGVKRVKGDKGSTRGGRTSTEQYRLHHETGQAIGYTDPDGFEQVADWECEPDCPIFLLDAQAGERGSTLAHPYDGHDAGWGGGTNAVRGDGDGTRTVYGYGDAGGPSRFFATFPADDEATRFRYVAKASRAERGGSTHPTMKPLALCSWLVRLATPPGGTVLDCFCGSGSILIAADRLGFNCIGIDSDPESIEIAKARLVGDCPLFAQVAD